MEVSPSWPLRTGDAWPTKAVPDGTDGPKPEANTFNCYPAQIKIVPSTWYTDLRSEQIETSCFKYFIINFNLLVIKKKKIYIHNVLQSFKLHFFSQFAFKRSFYAVYQDFTVA